MSQGNVICAGLVASLQANELPNPVVEVSVVDNPSFRHYEVAAARTLQVRRRLGCTPSCQGWYSLMCYAVRCVCCEQHWETYICQEKALRGK